MRITRPSRRQWAVVQAGVGATIIALLMWRVGTVPFRDGLRALTPIVIAAAIAIGALTTLASAVRWRVVARGLGVPIGLGTAFAFCYRSVFLNSTLPGGILGDAHRGVRHGQASGSLSRGLRAVLWERTAGQVVQVTLTLLVLSIIPSPVQQYVPFIALAVVAIALTALLLTNARSDSTRSRFARVLTAARADIRHGLLARGNWPVIALASVAAVVGYAATFVIAARTAGVAAPLHTLIPLAFVALLAMTVPFNLAGWGPREGAAAWIFGAVGLTVSQGVATSVVYGVLALFTSLPGAVVLAVAWVRRTRAASARHTAPQSPAVGQTAAPSHMARPAAAPSHMARPAAAPSHMARPSAAPLPEALPTAAGVPPATIRTRVTVPLRLPDGYATTADVFTFHGLVDEEDHLALGLGDWECALRRQAADESGPLVRLHSECLTGDVFGSQRCDCGPQLREAIERIAASGGFLLYLRQEGRGIGLYQKLDAYALQDVGLDTYEANRALGHREDERDYAAAAQMLAALGVERLALLTNNPDKHEQLGRLGAIVTECVPTGVYLSAANASYLAAKAARAAAR